jgi:hypothetical protein
VIQAIVNRTGWSSGNAIVILINGTGHRTANSWNGNAAGAPLLHIEAVNPGPQGAPSARASVAGEPPPSATEEPPFSAGAARRTEFALHGLSPNPSHGVLRVDLSLADDGAASIDVHDLMGRRIVSRDLGSPGPGRHVFEVREALPPGLYVVRLVQGSRSRMIKAVVVR